MKNNNVLITGGAGFIGSHLAENLVKKNFTVTVLDNLSTGNIENLNSLKGNNKFHFIEDSILNENIMNEVIIQNDYVFHLAASVGVKNIIENPLNSIINNTKGTEIVLNFCSKHKKN